MITGFFLRHSIRQEGVVGLFINGVLEAYQAMYLIILGEKEKGMAKVQKYTDDKDIDVSRSALLRLAPMFLM